MPAAVSSLFRLGRWVGLLFLAAAGIGHPTARGEGTVTEASTVALLQALGGGGLVQLTFTGTLTLEIPLLIAADTVLDGGAVASRATISGGDQFRLFRVLPGIRFEVRNLTLRQGRSTNGGAILNEGLLLASNVTFAACSAQGTDGAAGAAGAVKFGYGENGDSGEGGTAAWGGAVFNLGEATFLGCTFDGNEAVGGAGGAGGAGGDGSWRKGAGGDGGAGAGATGGAIENAGSLVVTNCLFVANSALGGVGGAGGGADGVAGSGQGGAGADAAGGAIHSTGLLFLAQSTFATNVVIAGSSARGGSRTFNIGMDGEDGGTALGGAVASWSTGQVVNVTFYTNLVAGGNGGGPGGGTFTTGKPGDGGDALGAALHVRGQMDLNHVTFAWNSGTNGLSGTATTNLVSRDGSPGRVSGTAIAADSSARVTVINSIFASRNYNTVDGPVSDRGHNLFTDGGLSPLGTGSLRDTDPVLSTYATWTSGPPGLVPLSGSPAIDAADPNASPGVDQRGFVRPAGAGPDLGAMEVGASSFFLAGQVLDGSRGYPGVRVEVGARWMLTDTDGRFRFGPLPSGFYTVAIADGGVGFTPRAVQVPLIADATNVVFRTTPLSIAFTRDLATGRNHISAAGLPSRMYRLEGGAVLGTWDALVSGSADAQGRIVFEHDSGTQPAWFYRMVAP